MNRNVLVCLILYIPILVCAQDDYLPYNNETDHTWISPYYFGPNAFPVPDMVKGTADKLEIEVNATGALGRLTPNPDYTVNTDLKIRLPLWTDRVNLSIWVQFWEWYWDNVETRKIRRVPQDKTLTGNLQGDWYFSVDMLLLRETNKCPAITARAACKSASGGQYVLARYYDAPGYFFDACIYKKINVTKGLSITAAASAGFLCWQVDNGRQNDAVMYGVSLGLMSKFVDFNADYGGYVGWKNEGDKPMTLKLRLGIIPDYFVSPFVYYQRGFVDWPFDQIKVGVTFSVDILKYMNKFNPNRSF